MKTAAERRAEALVVEYVPPVPVEEIARLQGAEVRYYPFDRDISGLLLRSEAATIIGVHSEHPKTRQRFTIAHELGHKVLHRGRPVIVEHLHRARANWRDGQSGLANDSEEIAANQFAAGLLMPQRIIEERFQEIDGRFTERLLIETLARQFEVSAQAMRFRLVNLALIDPV